MTYLALFLGFLRVGCFAFGGAYGAIPLIRDVVLTNGWLSESALTTLIAVSESTPGPIMVNLATYVGSVQGGLGGAIVATLAVVLPSFLVILLVMTVMKRLLQNPYVQAVLRGLKPCVTGIILATGVYMTVNRCFSFAGMTLRGQETLIVALLAAALLAAKAVKKKWTPVALIVLSACLGVIVF